MGSAQDTLEQSKKKLKANTWLCWITLALCVCAFSPLPYDPVPLMGPPAPMAGTGFFVLLVYLYLFRRRSIREAIVVNFADSNKSKITTLEAMRELGVNHESAKMILEGLRKKDILRKQRGGSDDEEVVYLLQSR